LAFDFGKAMVGSHLTALRRTKIGDYNVADALHVEESYPRQSLEVL
jgi:tRNA pseudouridine55 synthase